MKRAKRTPVKILPEARIDLHGLTIQTAYDFCLDRLQQYENHGMSNVEVITGKSGIICREFPFWMEDNGYTYKASDHGGSFLVKVRRS